MVKNLCSSQKCHPMSFFLTFTCNESKHFGISPIKNYIDSKEWEKNYPNFNELFESEKKKQEKQLIKQRCLYYYEIGWK